MLKHEAERQKEHEETVKREELEATEISRNVLDAITKFIGAKPEHHPNLRSVCIASLGDGLSLDQETSSTLHPWTRAPKEFALLAATCEANSFSLTSFGLPSRHFTHFGLPPGQLRQHCNFCNEDRPNPGSAEHIGMLSSCQMSVLDPNPNCGIYWRYFIHSERIPNKLFQEYSMELRHRYQAPGISTSINIDQRRFSGFGNGTS
jgi:hypothetical protein